MGFNTLGRTQGSSVNVVGSGPSMSFTTSCAIMVTRFSRPDSSWPICSESDGIVVTKMLLSLVKEKWRDNGGDVRSREEDLRGFRNRRSLAN
jgi:hypothetical protein